jgi:hypothetical protein
MVVSASGSRCIPKYKWQCLQVGPDAFQIVNDSFCERAPACLYQPPALLLSKEKKNPGPPIKATIPPQLSCSVLPNKACDFQVLHVACRSSSVLLPNPIAFLARLATRTIPLIESERHPQLLLYWNGGIGRVCGALGFPGEEDEGNGGRSIGLG